MSQHCGHPCGNFGGEPRWSSDKDGCFTFSSITRDDRSMEIQEVLI